ncbi:hypothetical protein FE257_009232 [Aspergillus nanangensis]|uniref:NADH dehydrogenase [ubiquinone] 1 alpha subcomplex subunit 1 n=1 Tax=Aspergillus nanangensis TaxID=2582783 RepID=A0AAD4CK96_ASPNN|nr:hypothetical protein FE257_009232 [Aspergillus nanangensis]
MAAADSAAWNPPTRAKPLQGRRQTSTTADSRGHKRSIQLATSPAFLPSLLNSNDQLLKMGVPFEALLPYGIMITMFGVTGAGLSAVKYFANDGKKARWNRDLWDRQSMYRIKQMHTINPNQSPFLMERDLRITGSLRGQSSNAEAPKGFEVSNPWKLEKRIF